MCIIVIIFSYKYSAGSWEKEMTTGLKRDRSANEKENIEENVSLAKIQSPEQDKFKTENRGNYFSSRFSLLSVA